MPRIFSRFMIDAGRDSDVLWDQYVYVSLR